MSADGSNSDLEEDIPAVATSKYYIFTAPFQPVLTIGGPIELSDNTESGSDIEAENPAVPVGK
jgi:hypothetical protein